MCEPVHHVDDSLGGCVFLYFYFYYYYYSLQEINRTNLWGGKSALITPELWSSSLFAVWESGQRRATHLNIFQNNAENSLKEKESAKVLLFTDASGGFSRNDQIININTSKINQNVPNMDEWGQIFDSFALCFHAERFYKTSPLLVEV